MPSERKSCGDGRDGGASVAKEDIIAFMDTDCVVRNVSQSDDESPSVA